MVWILKRKLTWENNEMDINTKQSTLIHFIIFSAILGMADYNDFYWLLHRQIEQQPRSI